VIIAVRKRRLEIPVIAVTANVTWEFLWGFVFRQNMGSGLQWVYRGSVARSRSRQSTYRVAAPSPELVIDLTREDLAESPSVGIRPPPA